MKELIVLSLGANTLKHVIVQLKKYVGADVQIKGYCIENKISEHFAGKLVLVTSELLCRLVPEHVADASKIIVARRTLSYENIDKMLRLKDGSEVLLVNDMKESCIEVMEQLKNHGFENFVYYPYYPGIETYRKCAIAITPGESNLAPEEVEQIIDIGTRQIDITTIVEIMGELDLIPTRGSIASSEFVKEIIELTKSLSRLNRKLDDTNVLLSNIFDKFPKALFFCDKDENVLYYNEEMKKIFPGLSLLHMNIRAILNSDFSLAEIGDSTGEILELNGKDYIASIDTVWNENDRLGYLLMMENYAKFKDLDTMLRSKLKKKEHVAPYHFDNLFYKDKKMERMVELAKKIARRDSTVLIRGESGTGKELLAQAIHNFSARRNKPFVAVNFASLSSSILESELFGYEEGAFTGAKKGGKTGMFEEAHEGTIFMDEIGDTPLDLQVKLLRVLQEGVVRRVGGNREIPIDVRIITATNVNLEEKVEQGLFRQDLYYRLNVLPIHTVSLRERRDDIPYLLLYYINRVSEQEYSSLEEYMTQETITFIKNHPWPGNVRELMNVVEYLVNIKEERAIEKSDLPTYLLEEAEKETIDREQQVQHAELSESDMILYIISKKFGIGRRKIVQELALKGVNMGEGKVKTIIKYLESKQLIEVKTGARGCMLTEKGKAYLHGR
ncbi:sigma-54 interaction domain-containing protein [Aneurinibacillus migulanus]|uniref:sigma-54 interaction domain-containing protein n=1 Tax=Aneurinibacillus migulanus TaxID=47500 RepID=UPI00069721D7|nr:sigma 54-interacting transcriptional regulator [Aneurinibacillus migulanus]MCP1357698.1 sigma 54-interacting transcriptional regulator [Aneurinibacillus migulanus]